MLRNMSQYNKDMGIHTIDLEGATILMSRRARRCCLLELKISRYVSKLVQQVSRRRFFLQTRWERYPTSWHYLHLQTYMTLSVLDLKKHQPESMSRWDNIDSSKCSWKRKHLAIQKLRLKPLLGGSLLLWGTCGFCSENNFLCSSYNFTYT